MNPHQQHLVAQQPHLQQQPPVDDGLAVLHKLFTQYMGACLLAAPKLALPMALYSWVCWDPNCFGAEATDAILQGGDESRRRMQELESQCQARGLHGCEKQSAPWPSMQACTPLEPGSVLPGADLHFCPLQAPGAGGTTPVSCTDSLGGESKGGHAFHFHNRLAVWGDGHHAHTALRTQLAHAVVCLHV